VKRSRYPFLRRLLREDRGQALPIIAVFLVALLGMAGLVLDVGHAYFVFRQLQASSDAAALAGAQLLPATTAAATATSYSSASAGKNVIGGLSGVTVTAVTKCLTTLTQQGIPCMTPSNANAIQVQQQVSVPTYFARLFGKNSFALTATATAAMSGSTPKPYNVAIVIDTTASMNNYDSDSNCSSTRIACALSGLQTLLSSLSPCAASLSTCGASTSGNVANSVDRVSLFTFPNVTLGTASYDYDCSSSSPTSKPYTFPTAGGTTYAPSGSSTPTYQIVGWSSDYRASDTATALSTTSNLALSSGAKTNCTGMQAPGGEGTYYAGVIYAAQASLAAEKAANPGSENVMILLSDGDATATSSQMGSGNSTTSGVYPSSKNECHQAITAGKASTAAGTTVYTIAYGATASGCTSDSPSITPCQTMQGIASSASTFFSDYTATGGSSSCVSAASSTTNLNQIFSYIVGSLGVVRLIPDNTP
jgi:Flp pilus assembly protein TadG